MINVKIQDRGVAFISYSGPFTTIEMPMLATFLRPLIKEMGGEVKVVVLDMSFVNYVNAAGLTALIRIWRLCQEKNIVFKLVSLGKWVKYVMAITKVDSLISCNNN